MASHDAARLNPTTRSRRTTVAGSPPARRRRAHAATIQASAARPSANIGVVQIRSLGMPLRFGQIALRLNLISAGWYWYPDRSGPP
jgi:hypothetical protein